MQFIIFKNKSRHVPVIYLFIYLLLLLLLLYRLKVCFHRLNTIQAEKNSNLILTKRLVQAISFPLKWLL